MRNAFSALILAVLTVLPMGIGTVAKAQEVSRPALTDMSPADREKLRTEIRAYLLEHPEVIMEAMQVLQARQEANKAKADAVKVTKYHDIIFNDGISWVGGNPKGDVTVVEFSDYRCAYCKRAFPEIKALLESDPNIRFVVKEFPILGPDSVAAGRMALAALKVDPDKYGKLHDALYSFHGTVTEEIAYKIAEHVGYDPAALKKEADTDAVKSVINANYALAQELELEGTPSFVIGDKIARGYLTLDQMKEDVAAARQAKK